MTFKKYPDIERLGHEDNLDILNYGQDTIVIEEKVDGGNGSFWLSDDKKDEGELHFGSRNRDLVSDKDEKTFQRQQILLREHMQMLEDEGINLNPDYIYYFEWMAPHTIRYTDAPFMIGFDIRLRHCKDNEDELGLFLGRESREKEFDRIKIENVPLIWRGTSDELKKLEIKSLIPKSKYYEGMAEGIVIKNYCRKSHSGNHQLYAKLVRDEFKEDNKAVFGSVRNPNSDTKKICDEFLTDARIKKAILKCVNEDNMKLDRSLMQKVPSMVIKDILKEEFNTIYDKYKFIDFKEMKQIIPKPCLRVIDEMMMSRIK